MTLTRSQHLWHTLALLALCGILALAPLTLAACGSETEADTSATETAQEETAATEEEALDEARKEVEEAADETEGAAEEEAEDDTDADEAADLDAQDVIETDVPFSEDLDLAKCVDDHGNPTLYALTECTGTDLVQLLVDNGFALYSSDEVEDVVWLSDHGLFSIYNGAAKQISAIDYLTYEKGCAGTEALLFLSIEAYDAFESLYDCLIGKVVTVLDTAYVNGGISGFNVIENSEGRTYLCETVLTDSNEDGSYDLFNIYVFNEEAVAAGMLDTIANGSYGSTPAEVLENLRAQSSNG